MPCVNWSRCAKKEMACEAYKNYYETGDIMGNKEPTTIIYKGIFDVGFGSA
jgi:hypothetical protein